METWTEVPSTVQAFPFTEQDWAQTPPAVQAYVPVLLELGDTGVSAASIGILGNEPLIGRNLARRFRITLGHLRCEKGDCHQGNRIIIPLHLRR